MAGDEASLLQVLSGEADLKIKVQAVSSLSRLPQLSEKGKQVLLKHFNVRDAALKQAIISILVHFKVSSVIELLMPLLEDKNAEMRTCALNALGQLDHPKIDISSASYASRFSNIHRSDSPKYSCR